MVYFPLGEIFRSLRKKCLFGWHSFFQMVSFVSQKQNKTYRQWCMPFCLMQNMTSRTLNLGKFVFPYTRTSNLFILHHAVSYNSEVSKTFFKTFKSCLTMGQSLLQYSKSVSGPYDICKLYFLASTKVLICQKPRYNFVSAIHKLRCLTYLELLLSFR